MPLSNCVRTFSCVLIIKILLMVGLNLSGVTSYKQDTSIQQEHDPGNYKDTPLINLSVGDNETFICKLSFYSNIAWYINDTIYDRDMLPDDYYYYYMESSGYIAFVISEAKLWMNNTLYGCYEVQNDKKVEFAHILVNFDFSGPTNNKIAVTGSDFDLYFIPCNTSSIEKYPLTVLWQINGVIFSKDELSAPYYQKQHGLLIRPLNNSVNGTKFQCLIHSRLLLKDFYYSSISTITVAPFGTSGSYIRKVCAKESNICTIPESRNTFKFLYKNFLLNNQTKKYKLAWNEASSCSEPYHYEIIGTCNTNAYVKIVNGTSAILSANDLQFNGTDYNISINAVDANNENCSSSKGYIQLSPQVTTENFTTDIGSNFCFKTNNSVKVIFPMESSDDFCTCAAPLVIKNCSCIGNEFFTYTLFNKGQEELCLANLTADMNDTRLLVVINIQNSRLMIGGNRILQSYRIIIQDNANCEWIKETVNITISLKTAHASSLAYNVECFSNYQNVEYLKAIIQLNDSRSQELNCSHHSLVFAGLQSSSIYFVKILVGDYMRSRDYCIYQNSSKPYKTVDEKNTSLWTTEIISIIVALVVIILVLIIFGLLFMYCCRIWGEKRKTCSTATTL